MSGGSCAETDAGRRDNFRAGGPRSDRTEVEATRNVRTIGVSNIDPRNAARARHAEPKLVASWLSSTKWRNTIASTITRATRSTGPSTGWVSPRSSSDRSRIMVGNRSRSIGRCQPATPIQAVVAGRRSAPMSTYSESRGLQRSGMNTGTADAGQLLVNHRAVELREGRQPDGLLCSTGLMRRRCPDRTPVAPARTRFEKRRKVRRNRSGVS
jgi:hypothetical protein